MSNQRSKTLLSLPNPGRTPTWTGLTQSGDSIHSIVPMANRRIQLHFCAKENIIPFAHNFENRHYQRLGTFLYEYPLRHLGIYIDNVERPPVSETTSPSFFTASGLPIFNPRIEPRIHELPLRGHGTRANRAMTQLKLDHAPTVGREIACGCPEIGNQLALSNLQATSIVYSHHQRENVLSVKVFIGQAPTDFARDHSAGFPDFKFHQPLHFRRRYSMGDEIYLSRNGIY